MMVLWNLSPNTIKKKNKCFNQLKILEIPSFYKIPPVWRPEALRYRSPMYIYAYKMPTIARIKSLKLA